jgi:hypothetical protein
VQKSEIFEGIDILISTPKSINKLFLVNGVNTSKKVNSERLGVKWILFFKWKYPIKNYDNTMMPKLHYISQGSQIMIRKIILLAAFIASIQLVQAQNDKLDDIDNLQEFVNIAKKGKWKQAQDQDGIRIYYRDLELFDSLETREMSLKLGVSGTIESILSQLKQPVKLKSWNDGIRSAEMLRDNNDNWVLHTVYKIPWPFSQQDMVSEYSIEQGKDTVLISSKSVPDFIKPIKGVTREGYNLSQWLITSKNNGLFEIKFSAISLTNSSIPRWIKDPLLQRMLIKSFKKLKGSL